MVSLVHPFSLAFLPSNSCSINLSPNTFSSFPSCPHSFTNSLIHSFTHSLIHILCLSFTPHLKKRKPVNLSLKSILIDCISSSPLPDTIAINAHNKSPVTTLPFPPIRSIVFKSICCILRYIFLLLSFISRI